MDDHSEFAATITTIIGTLLLVATGDPKIVAGVALILIGYHWSYHQ